MVNRLRFYIETRELKEGEFDEIVRDFLEEYYDFRLTKYEVTQIRNAIFKAIEFIAKYSPYSLWLKRLGKIPKAFAYYSHGHKFVVNLKFHRPHPKTLDKDTIEWFSERVQKLPSYPEAEKIFKESVEKYAIKLEEEGSVSWGRKLRKEAQKLLLSKK